MVRDYSERRQMNRAVHTRRPSVWPSVLLILVLMLAAFAAGLATGRYLFRPGGRFSPVPAMQPPVAAPKQDCTLPPQGEPIAPATPSPSTPQSHPPAGQKPAEGGNGAPPLTFYHTLPKGNRELIGTGINPPNEGKQPAAPNAATPHPPER